LIEKDLEAQRSEIIANLEKGQVLEGIVKNITDFGAFIDLGGIDGLLHITDISWGRVANPRDVLTLDQKINIVILNFEDGKKRISLGLKQLTPHPWDALTENLEVGSRIKGKVVNIADYGAFIEVAQGVEGLIHVSEMSWSQHLRNPSELLKVEQEIETVILSIDREERKMSLGLNIADKYTVGSRHLGKVRNLTNFGLFVELGEGVDGLVHISDLSWTKKINHAAEFTKKDEEIEVVVLEIDNDNRRLSLGHKQLEENPWDTFETIFIENSNHEAKVISADEKGAVVELPYGLEGFVPRKHLNRENGTAVKVSETATFRVIEFSKDNRRIVLSHARTWEAANAAADTETQAVVSKKKAEQATAATAAPSMGDMDVLSSLKAGMVEEEKKAQQEAIKVMDAKVKKKPAKKDEANADDTTESPEETTPAAE
jgi:small subunit ribosomal protein S1